MTSLKRFPEAAVHCQITVLPGRLLWNIVLLPLAIESLQSMPKAAVMNDSQTALPTSPVPFLTGAQTSAYLSGQRSHEEDDH